MHLLNFSLPLTLYFPLCTQAMIDGGVNTATMWEHEWGASTRSHPNAVPLAP